MKPSTKDPAFLGALAYFNVAAATQSFQNAAAELGVTPSAVSHRIAALEEAMGQKLFRRETRKVSLTQEGAEFAKAAKDALGEIRAAVEGLASRQVLRVSVGPYLSSTWLMGRLKIFERAQPTSRIDLIHVIGTALPRDADVSIVWQDTENRDKNHRILFDTTTVPVAAPGYVAGPRFWSEDVVPIHYRDRQAWRHWLAGANGPISFAERGEVLDDPLLVFEAAAHGRGIAVGFLPFIAKPLAEGRLVTVSENAVTASRVYTVAINNPASALAERFSRWLFEQAAMSKSANIS